MIDGKHIKQTHEVRVRPWEHVALLAVMKKFDEGYLSLNMRTTGQCLGSRVALLGGRNPFIYMGLVYSHSLRELYFPGIRSNGSIDYDNPGWDAFARDGARAIANFLVDLDPRWNEVMRRRR